MQIMVKEANYWRRLILEGVAIKFSKNLANLQAGYEIDEIWTPILQSYINKEIAHATAVGYYARNWAREEFVFAVAHPICEKFTQ